jgi:hypothetical protein
MKRLVDHLVLRRWLSAYLDQELPGEALERVRSHIAICRACQRNLVKIRSGRDFVASGQIVPALAQRRIRWEWAVAAAAVVIAVLAVPWSATVHAMDVNFYAAQFRSAGYCAYPCVSLSETTFDTLRSSAPIALEYPEKMPGSMGMMRVIRYRTAKYEGVGMLFAGGGKRFWIFEQPRQLSVAANNLPTGPISICGRECTRIECAQVRLLNWTKDGLSFVVATDLEKPDVEAIVASLRRL